MTDEFSAATVPESCETLFERPHFRLHHLFALIAVVALMLAISGPRNIRGIEVPSLVQLAFTGLGIVYTIMASIAITIVAYGVAWRRYGQTFLDAPGHWLLVSIAVNQLLVFFEILTLRVLAAIQGVSIDVVWTQLPRGATLLFPGFALLILNIYIGRTKCRERYWSRVFYANAMAAIVPFIGDLLVLLYLERAIRAEKPQRPPSDRWKKSRGLVQPITAEQLVSRKRDSAHRCGVVIAFAMASMTVFIVFGMLTWIILPAFFG